MVAESKDQKITYTTMSVEQAESFNTHFDEALGRVTSELGQPYPIYIDGRAVQTDRPTFESRSPNDTRMILGSFQEARHAEAVAAVGVATRAFEGWSRTPWQERIAIMRRAAENFRSRKYDIGALLALEAGKARLEAMGEVEEAADLITTYCDQMEGRNGFDIEMSRLTDREVNHSLLRPFGVWVVIAPFNFPIALATGMLAGALIGGNTVVFKPSSETPLAGINVYRCLTDAGLPDGVVNLLTGAGNETGEALSSQDGLAGIAFTGSKAVGFQIDREFRRNGPRPVIAELGGKNPVIVTNAADLNKAVEGTARAAFGYSGQKCSAASRVYVQTGVAEEFVQKLAHRTEQMKVGNPVDAGAFTGPVINERAYLRFQEACRVAASDGQILTGGSVLNDGPLAHGYYCGLTLAALPADHRFFYEELFVPLLSIARVESLREGLERANDSEYGLTAGLFSEDLQEQQTFLQQIEAGVVYVNRRAGATTGAWPGVQSFGGWKASGSTGKSALGFYYIQQFMREQNQTVVSD
ncbi:MAG: aldehyde dehydrogenase family protein [Chloroflexota bacterium]